MNLGTLALLFVALVWGSTFPLVKNAIAVFPPTLFNAFRFDVATICLGGLCVVSRARWTTKTVLSGMVIGFFLFLGYSFQTVGMQWTSSTNAALLVGLVVILVPLLLWAVFGTKITPMVALATGLAAVGVFFINGCHVASITKGDLFQILGTFFFSCQIVGLSRISKTIDLRVLNFSQMATVAVLSHVIAEPLVWPSTFPIVSSLLFTGIFCSAVAFALQTWASHRLSPISVTLILATEPLFGALFSYLFYKEAQPWTVYVGGVLLFISVILAEIKLEKKAAAGIGKSLGPV